MCNHVNCSSGYCMENFPRLNAVGSVMAEVYNAHFKNVLNSTGFMTKSNFMKFTRHFMCVINSQRLATIEKIMATNGQKASEIREVNKLVREMQLAIANEDFTVCGTLDATGQEQLCSLCSTQ